MAAGSTTLGRLLVELFLDDQGFSKGMDRAKGTLQSAGGAMTKFADVVQGAVVGAFKAGTAAAAAFTAASVAVGATFEQQMAMVGAISGATGEEFEALTQQARALGASTEFTATQAAEALEALARGGLDVEQSITASNAALLMAGTSGASLADSANLLVATMRQFGLEASDTTRIMDVFSKAQRTSLLDFSALREAMKFAGTAGASFGMTLEETTAAVAAFRDLGLEGSLAGTNFRMAMIQAAKGSSKADAALRRYGLTLDDVNPATNSFAQIMATLAEVGISATDAITVFGARSGANVAQLAANEAKAQGLADSLGEAQGQLAELTKQQQAATRAGEATNEQATERIALLQGEVAALQEQADRTLTLQARTDSLAESAGSTADMYEFIGQTVVFQSKIAISALQDLMIEFFGQFAEPLRDVLEQLPILFNAMAAQVRARSAELQAAFGMALGDLRNWLEDEGPRLAIMFGDLVVALAKVVGWLGRMVPKLELIGVLMISAFAAIKVVQLAAALRGLVLGIQATVLAMQTMGAAAMTTQLAFGAVGVAVAATTAALLLFEKRTVEIERRAMAPLRAKAKAWNQELGENSDQLAQLARQYVLSGGSAVEFNRVVAQGFKATQDHESAILNEAAALTKRNAVLERQIEGAFEAIAAEEERSQAAAKASEEQEAAQRELQERMAALQAEMMQGQRDLEADRAAAGSEADSEVAKQRQELLAQLLGWEQEASDKLSQLRDGDVEHADTLHRRELRSASELWRGLAATYEEGSAERLQIEDRANRALRLMDEAYQAERRKQLREQQEREAKERAEALRKQEAILLGIRRQSMTKVERLQAELTDALAATDLLSTDQRAEIQRIYNERITEASEEAAEQQKEEWRKRLDELAAKFQAVAEVARRVFSRIADAARRGAQAVGDLIGGITGGAALDLDTLLGMAGEATSAEEAAAAVDELVQGAVTFAQAVAANIGTVVESLIAALPDLIQAVVDALPVVLQAIVDGLGPLLDSVIGAIPDIVQAVAEAIPDLMRIVGEALPGLVQTLADQLPLLTQAILAELPTLILGIIEGLRIAIVAILDELPTLLRGILEMIPTIIQAIVAALPSIFTALFRAIPEIILVILDAIPAIIMAIVENVPTIILALVDAIFTELLPRIPEIVIKLIETLVSLVGQIATSLVGDVGKMIPELIGMVIGSLPELVTSLFSLFTSLLFSPDFWADLTMGLLEAVWEAIKALGAFFADVIAEITSLGSEETATFGDTPGVVRAGFQGLAARFAPGDLVVAARRPADLLAQVLGHLVGELGRARGGAAPSVGPTPAQTPANSVQPVQVAVVAEGRLLEAVMVTAGRRGHAPKVQAALRRGRGVRIGQDRGKFTAWSS